METNGNKIQPNSATRFYCKFCDYGTNKKSNYDTHLISSRHSKNSAKETFGNQIQPNSAKIQLVCEHCKKSFHNRSGLWKHTTKSNCIKVDEDIKEDSSIKDKEHHPGCNYSESKYSDKYSKLVIEAMGGLGNNDDEKEAKIIKNISKEVIIDKNL